MHKLAVALCILQVFEKNIETFAAITDKVVVKKYRTTEERDAHKNEILFVVTGFGSMQHRPPWLRMFTASMIAQRWALTCGHCVESMVNPSIWYGQLTEASFNTKAASSVLNIYFHPAYHAFPELKKQERIMDNNLALLRVSEINLQFYGRILSVDYMSLIGLPVTTVGGGKDSGVMNKTGNDEKTHIQTGQGVVMACSKDVRGFNRHMLCVTPKCSSGDESAAAADAGAPLLYNGKIIAVQNYDFTDGSRVRISYTPISPYIDWISTTIGNRRNEV